MLIRQKAGWRLHHQAYLWPRRSRASPLSSISTSLLLPQRRRSVASSGSSAVQSGNDGSSSPLSRRRSSSSGSQLDGEDTSPFLLMSSRHRTGSCEVVDTSTSSLSSSAASSPRKRKASGSLELDIDDLFSSHPAGLSAGHRSRCSSVASDQALEESSSQKRRRESTESGDRLTDHQVVDTAVDGFNMASRTMMEDAVTRTRTVSQTRSEPASVRKRRDTRSGDSRGAESGSPVSSSHSSSLKGSSSGNNNNNHLPLCGSSNINSSSGNNNNNHLPLCGSNYTSPSLKESNNIRDSVHRSSVNCSRSNRMVVLCTEQHGMGERCECEGMSANSPQPATVHSFPPSPCGNSQDVLKRLVPRKRSLDAAIHETDVVAGTAIIRRRTIRSPSAGSINGVVGHAAMTEKLGSEISAAVGQNGFKRESGLNGVTVGHGYQNGTRPFCCLGIATREACSKCMAHHHPITITPLSSPLPPLLSSPPSSQTEVPQVSLSCQNGRSVISSHSSVGLSTQPRPTPTSVLSVGSTAQPVTDDINSGRRPQHPSSLSPFTASSLSSTSAAPASQQQNFHPPTQGSVSSNISNSNSSSSDDQDDVNTDTTVAFSSRCISPNPTVLSLRHRPLPGNIVQKSLSQPASPQASTSTLSRSKSLLPSSSLPSLSTLITEPSSPVTPTVVQCRWRGCSCGLDASDLLEHIRKHVESQIEKKTYACLWTDCKVFNKPSWSDSWLERHIVSHSGHRPFKCILDNCGQRFHSQAALERHVNGHFTASSQNGPKSGRTREEISHRMLQKRKRQLKRKFVQTVKRNDFFDEQTMAVIKNELVSLADQTELDLAGHALHTTFHGLIVGKRSTKTGCRQALMEFTPSDVLEDKWSPEEETIHMSKMSVLLSCLPNDTITNLHDSFYRPHRFRKHRRK